MRKIEVQRRSSSSGFQDLSGNNVIIHVEMNKLPIKVTSQLYDLFFCLLVLTMYISHSDGARDWELYDWYTESIKV